MTLQVPVGYGQCRYIFRCAGVLDEMGFTLGVDSGHGLTPLVVAQQSGLAFDNNVWTGGTSANVNYTFVGTSFSFMTATGPLVAEDTVNIAGTLSAAVPPPNLSLLISKATASGGREHRGRVFMPTATVFESEVDHAGVLLAATVLAYQTAWSGFLADLVAVGIGPVILHTNPATAPTVVTAFSVESLMATQRRRMR